MMKTEEEIREYMITILEDFPALFLDECGEVNYTHIAEFTANELGIDNILDEETHFIWDLAIEIGDTYLS